MICTYIFPLKRLAQLNRANKKSASLFCISRTSDSE